MAKQDVWIPSDSDAPRVKQPVTEKSKEKVWVPDDTQAPRVPMNATEQAPRVPVRPEPEQAPRVPMNATEQAWDVVKGTGELAATLATGAVAPVAGALGVLAAQGRNLSRRVANAFGADRPLEDTQVYRETRDKYTYQPRSESGQASVRALGALVEPIIEPVVGAVAKVPGMGRDNAEFLVDAAMMGTGAKAAKSPRASAATVASDVVEGVKTTGRVAKDVATEMPGKVAGATMRTAERAVDFAKENPIATSAAGAAAGYLATGPIGAAAGYAVKSLLDKSRAADVAITSGIDEIAKTTSARNNRVRGEGAFSIPTGPFAMLEDMSAVKQAELARKMGSAGVEDFVRIYNNSVVANEIDRLKSTTGKTTAEILKRDKNDELLNSLRKMKAEEEFPDLSGVDLVDAWTARYLDRGLLKVSESSPVQYYTGQRGIAYVTPKEFNRLKDAEAKAKEERIKDERAAEAKRINEAAKAEEAKRAAEAEKQQRINAEIRAKQQEERRVKEQAEAEQKRITDEANKAKAQRLADEIKSRAASKKSPMDLIRERSKSSDVKPPAAPVPVEEQSPNNGKTMLESIRARKGGNVLGNLKNEVKALPPEQPTLETQKEQAKIEREARRMYEDVPQLGDLRLKTSAELRAWKNKASNPGTIQAIEAELKLRDNDPDLEPRGKRGDREAAVGQESLDKQMAHRKKK